MTSYVIAVPSRMRSCAVSPLIKQLAKVRLYVGEPESAYYRAGNPGIEVATHPGLPTIGAIRQFILDHSPEDCVVMLDDDLKCVRPVLGLRRKAIHEPAAIMKIIENGMVCARDLGISLFSWNRNPNGGFLQPHDPLGIAQPCAGCFGIIGRKLRFDETLQHGEDMDITLQGLMVDRIVLQDRRFYFDFGLVGAGNGGLQGVRSQEKIDADIEVLTKRWGPHLELKGRPRSQHFKKGTVRSRSASIRVRRRIA